MLFTKRRSREYPPQSAEPKFDANDHMAQSRRAKPLSGQLGAQTSFSLTFSNTSTCISLFQNCRPPRIVSCRTVLNRTRASTTPSYSTVCTHPLGSFQFPRFLVRNSSSAGHSMSLGLSLALSRQSCRVWPSLVLSAYGIRLHGV